MPDKLGERSGGLRRRALGCGSTSSPAQAEDDGSQLAAAEEEAEDDVPVEEVLEELDEPEESLLAPVEPEFEPAEEVDKDDPLAEALPFLPSEPLRESVR